MKETLKKPQIEIIVFDNTDIILGSNDTPFHPF